MSKTEKNVEILEIILRIIASSLLDHSIFITDMVINLSYGERTALQYTFK